MPKRHEAALRVKPLYQKGAQSLSDTEALEVKGIYPMWEDLIGTAAEVDYKFTHNDVLYKVIQAHTFQSNWVPGTGTESLYVVVDEIHAGKYYSQDGVVYYCTRDTINPVYAALADLVPLYVEVVNG